MLDELDRAAQALADAITVRDGGPAGRVDTAVVAATPALGDATVGVYLGGSDVAVPARPVAGVVPVAGDRVLVWRSGSRLWLLGRVPGFVSSDGKAFREAAGAVLITPSAANTPTKANVTFPSGRFTQPPLVQVAANTTAPGTVVTGVSYANVTTSGCEVWLTRINTVATTVGWTAVQMTPTSAAG